MKITKQRFLFFVFAMVVTAGLLAWQIPANDRDLGSADAVYLMITVVIVALCIRLEAFSAALAAAYGSSLLFCFFYVFIAPFEAPVVMLLFFVPALLWQKKQIGCLHLSISSAILIWLSWRVLGRPAILILLLPTCQIFAIRLTASVHSRFAKDGTDVGVHLSRKQRQQIVGSDKNLDSDWWEIVRPEVEAFPERIGELWQELTGNAPRRHLGDDSVLDLHLLKLQNAAIMSSYLTNIKRRDEKFESDIFLKRVEKIFWKIQNAWYAQKPDSIQHLISDALFEQFKCQIEEQKVAGLRYQHENMTIYETRLAQINCDSSFDVIHVFIRASTADALIDLGTDKVIAQNEENRKFSEYWTFIRRPSAKTLDKPGLLEGQCPNCGSNIKIGQATVCSVCGSFIRSGFFDWVLAKITQACEWEYSESSLLADWRTMKANDPDFTAQQIEDRSAVIFWMQRLCERNRGVEAIQRFATEPFCHYYALSLDDDSGRGYSYLENVNLASVTLKGFKLTKFWDSLYLLVVYSGVPVMLNSSGRVIEGRRYSRVFREVMVLGRRHGVRSNLNNTLSSAHCPGCGGPMTSAFAISCTYCNSILNEGSNSWILEKMTGEGDPSYQQVLAKIPDKQIEEEDHQSRSARDIISIMAQVLLADGKVEISEMELLEKIAERVSMSEADLNSIIWSLKQGHVYIPSPQDAKESWDLLLAAARMALADDVLSPEEEHVLLILAQHLGYSKADVLRAIKAEQKRRVGDQKDESRKEAFRKLNEGGSQ